jgi:hypothetical protein
MMWAINRCPLPPAVGRGAIDIIVDCASFLFALANVALLFSDGAGCLLSCCPHAPNRPPPLDGLARRGGSLWWFNFQKL